MDWGGEGRGQQESNLKIHSNKECSVSRHPETPNKQWLYNLLLANNNWIQKEPYSL
jgi:hypothetical protein